MCKKQEFTFASSNGKTDIGATMWAPEGEARGVMQISHGICEHIDRYDDFAWAWTWNLLHEIYPDSYGKDFIPSLCLPVIRKWETAATTLNRQIIADATKDISTGSLAGFGIDGGEETAVDDALAVRGTVQQCGIIQELEKQQTEIKEKAGYWLHKLTL